MSASVGLTVVLTALTLAVVCLVLAARGRSRPPTLGVAVVGLQLGLTVQGVLDVVHLVGDRPQPEPVTNAGYLVVSLVALPLFAVLAKSEPNRWGMCALALGCALAAVVTVRLHATVAPAG